MKVWIYFYNNMEHSIINYIKLHMLYKFFLIYDKIRGFGICGMSISDMLAY